MSMWLQFEVKMMRANLKVAVVDDDLEMGRVVKDLLTQEGYEV